MPSPILFCSDQDMVQLSTNVAGYLPVHVSLSKVACAVGALIEVDFAGGTMMRKTPQQDALIVMAEDEGDPGKLAH